MAESGEEGIGSSNRPCLLAASSYRTAEDAAAPGRMERSSFGCYPGWSLADSLDPGLIAVTPSGSPPLCHYE